MCFSVHVDTQIKQLADKFQASPHNLRPHIQTKPLGYTKKDKLPVIAYRDDKLSIREMTWSLCPRWSKEFPAPWSTYNARMEREQKGIQQKIYDVPTFRNAFRKHHFCVVPITGAVEACYWGEAAGKIALFNREDQKEFYVLGLWEDWVEPKTGEIHETCTLITDGPYSYFFDKGHDRSIVAVKEDAIVNFLKENKRGYRETFDWIRKIRTDEPWSYEVVREMKDGWQKRVPGEREIEDIKRTVWG